MNFYAVIREPDMIEIDEIRNFPRETVKIEGVLTGYVRDPYGENDRLTSKFKMTATLLRRSGGTLIVITSAPDWHCSDGRRGSI